MKVLSKIALSALAIAGLATVAPAAQAAGVSPTGPVTVSGQLTQSFPGGYFRTVCDVTFQGTADATGVTLTAYDGVDHDNTGTLPCEDIFHLPLRLESAAPSTFRIPLLVISNRFGTFIEEGMAVSASNSTIVLPEGTAVGGVLQLHGVLTVSPALAVD